MRKYSVTEIKQSVIQLQFITNDAKEDFINLVKLHFIIKNDLVILNKIDRNPFNTHRRTEKYFSTQTDNR